MTKVIDDSNLGYLISKIKAAFWPKTDVVQIDIDNTPTVNSNNLVKSGGVYTALSNYYNKISGISLTTNTYPQADVSYERNSLLYTTTVNPDSVCITGYGELNGLVGDGSTTTEYLNGTIRFNGLDNSTSELYIPNNTYGTIATLNDIPTAVTESTVSGWGFTKNTGTYSKPSGGIPATDLASAVQTSLGKADTALQSYTETDPVYSASAASGITSSDITNWNSKTSNTGTITGINMNGASKGTSGVVDLGTVITAHATRTLTATNNTATAVNQGTEITYVESLTGTNTATSGNLTVTATRKKVTVPTAVTESTVSGWGFTKNTGTLTSETDPVFTASAAHGISSTDISNWNAKQKAITISSSEPTSSQGSNGDIWIVV